MDGGRDRAARAAAEPRGGRCCEDPGHRARTTAGIPASSLWRASRPATSSSLETRDGLDGQLDAREQRTPTAARSTSGSPTRSPGPVFVDGAEPGDVLEVEILGYETPGFGVNGVIPGFGFLADVFTEPFLVRWELDGALARSAELPGVAVSACVHAGVSGWPLAELMELQRAREERIRAGAGLSPTTRPRRGRPPLAAPGLRTIPPRENGGNLDIRRLVAGSTLLLPVHVPGALLSLGDVHFAQGDGEVCGTGIEIEAAVRVRRRTARVPRWVPRFPAYLTPARAARACFATTGIPRRRRDGPDGRARAALLGDDRLARGGARPLPPCRLLPLLGVRRPAPVRRSWTSRTRSSPR